VGGSGLQVRLERPVRDRRRRGSFRCSSHRASPRSELLNP
jgi:hypothetical protein